MHRRTFLLGASALVAACASKRHASAPFPPGPTTSSVASSGRQGTVESGTLDSAHMHGLVGWTVATPSVAPTGVVYCLHGKDEDHSFAFEQIHVHDVAAAARLPVVVAGVDGGADSYWHPRADGTDALAMVLDEFIPFVEQKVGLTNPTRIIMGWSMGGYGSLRAGEIATDRFGAVVVASPALWTSSGSTAPGAFDNADDYKRNDVFGPAGNLAPLVVRVDCGTSDPFYSAAKAFVARLPHPPEGGFETGGHDADYWRSVAPAQMQTIGGVLG